ncbi:MAG: ParM/StbA family protein [Cyanobacteria bacterium P01_A01_bin.45]
MVRSNRKSSRKNIAPTQLTVAVDIGGSGLKAIYMNAGGKLGSLFMEPEAIAVPKTAIDEFLQLKGVSEPINSAWVGFDGKYVAVGYLAASRFYANAGLKELKYERGIFKILALLWVLGQKLNLGNTFKVDLAVVLPASEYESRKKLEKILRSSVFPKYETPTGEMSLELGKFSCYPEGAGVFLLHSKRTGTEIQQKKSAIAMIGYRNASVLVSYRGALDSGKTSDLGMIRMIETVMSKTSGFSESQLCKAIVASRYETNTNSLYKLARSNTVGGRNQEVSVIVKAVNEAKQLYTATLTSWLNNVVPHDVDEIIFCGGTAEYLKKELNSHYSRIPCIWHGGIVIPEAIDTYKLGFRLTDVYGVFLYFLSDSNSMNNIKTEVA